MPLALGLVGFLDDLRSLPAGVRLVVQVVAAGVALVAVTRVESMSIATAVLGLALFVSFVNAFNFMDGVNGISALNAAVAGGWFAIVGHDRSVDSAVALGLVLTGVALGFLPWNVPTARLFLGDCGGYPVRSSP